jgi:hypothetical protein
MIVQALVDAFLLDLLKSVAQDVFRMALYTADADLSAATPAYMTQGEVPVSFAGPNGNEPTGYGAGGIVLTGLTVHLEGGVAFLDWADPVWPRSTITARAGLIYNFSKNNRAVAVLDLGKNFTSTNGNFTVTLPPPTAAEALIGIGG